MRRKIIAVPMTISVIKWFYIIIIILIICIDLFECRQHNTHTQVNDADSDADVADISKSEYDLLENDSGSNSGIRGISSISVSSQIRNHNHNHNHKHKHKHNRNNGQRYVNGGSNGFGGGGGGGVDGNGNGDGIVGVDDNDGLTVGNGVGSGHHNHHKRGHRKKKHYWDNMEDNDISLWISEPQLQMLSALLFPQGYYPQGRIYAIENGHVLNDIRDAVDIYKYLTIPSEVSYVNFTWKSGKRKYYYNFDRLQSSEDTILKSPTVSIKRKGRVPQEEKSFSIFLPCTGNNSGTAMFNLGLSIQNRRGKPLPGTPLRLSLKKECAHRGVYDSLDASNTTLTTSQGPDPECNSKCGNNGFCNHKKICQCRAGYTGQYCQTAFCFPQCLNGGNCTAPSVCTCPDGYQGTQCEGGICKEKCLNGGKCIQKDKCQCSKGYYGLHCEYSKCVIPCKNGGKCTGNNLCRCPHGLRGNHCEIGRKQARSTCKRPCKHGTCMANKTCKCKEGFFGQFCNGRDKKHRRNR